MARLNPLLLPEILRRVGDFIPAWIPTSTTTSYEFYPQGLIACALTSRIWYQTFYPLLWTVFDGRAFSSLSSFSSTHCRSSPPDEFIRLQSPGFRIITNYDGRLGGNLECRHLIELTLLRICPRSVHLVRMNKGLKRLCWIGAIPYAGMLSDLETAAMQDLDALEELTLQQWDVSKGRLVQVLKRNRRSLVRLNLRGIQGFDSLYDENKDSQSELSSQEETRLSKGYQKHGNERNEQDREVLVMDHLKELTVDCEWVENRALLDFVTQCCPNLERLRLSYDLAHDTSMMDKLDAKLATQHRVSVKTTLGDVQYQFVAERY